VSAPCNFISDTFAITYPALSSNFAGAYSLGYKGNCHNGNPYDGGTDGTFCENANGPVGTGCGCPAGSWEYRNLDGRNPCNNEWNALHICYQ
jgi:hypothetical protein